jgi:hypothetical protein
MIESLKQQVGTEQQLQLGKIFRLYRHAIHVRKGLFDPDNAHMSHQDVAPYLSATLSLVTDYSLHEERCSVRDWVTIKEWLSFCLMAKTGGEYHDAIDVPVQDHLFVEKQIDFLPMVSYSDAGFHRNYPEHTVIYPDIYSMSCNPQAFSWQRRQFVEFMCQKAANYSYAGQHDSLYPQVDRQTGKRYYSAQEAWSFNIVKELHGTAKNIGDTLCVHEYDEGAGAQSSDSSKTRDRKFADYVKRRDDSYFRHGVEGSRRFSWPSLRTERVFVYSDMRGNEYVKLFTGSHKAKSEEFNPTFAESLEQALATRLSSTTRRCLQERRVYLSTP